MTDIDAVWARIKRLEGAELYTKTGKPFTFTVSGDSIRPSRTNYILAKTEFGKALSLVPLDGPGAINNLVRGPAYIWAILHHPEVRRSDW